MNRDKIGMMAIVFSLALSIYLILAGRLVIGLVIMVMVSIITILYMLYEVGKDMMRW